MSSLEVEVNNLVNAYALLEDVFHIKNHQRPSVLHNPMYTQNYNHLKVLINEIQTKTQNVLSLRSPKRNKRGLFNFIGSASKWIIGTLDASDGERYDHAINVLSKNQNKILAAVNQQLSLAKELTQKYLSTLKTINANQQRIMHHISDLKNDVEQINIFGRFLSLIDQTIIDSILLITFLDNLENSITFAKLHTIHPDILTIKELQNLLNDLGNLYHPQEILKLKYVTWYTVLHVNCYFTESSVVFAIDFPLIKLIQYQYYHLHPLPTSNNTLIIPPKPYVALTKDSYQYMDQECLPIEENYLCKQENLRIEQSDCVVNLIQGKHPTCQTIRNHPVNYMIRKINENYILLISKEEKHIEIKCQESQFYNTKGSNLVYLPKHCKLLTETLELASEETPVKGHPFILPKIQGNFKSWKQQPLQIENVPLKNIVKLQEQVQALRPVTIEDLDNNIASRWLFWALVLIVCLLLAGLSLFALWKLKNNNNLETAIQVEEGQQRNPPSVLFTPEVVS